MNYVLTDNFVQGIKPIINKILYFYFSELYTDSR